MAKYLSLPFSCAPFFVTCFDETFTMLAIPNNMICILSILMEKTPHRVYFGSQFMSHGSATDLKQTFKD